MKITDPHEKGEAARLRRRLEKGDCSLNTEIRYSRDNNIFLLCLMDKYGVNPIEDFAFKTREVAQAAIDGVKDLLGDEDLDEK